MNRFKALLAVLMFSFSAFCLQPPYILTAVGQTSRTIAISWRNNDLNSAGFVLFQKIAGAASYSKAGTQTNGTSFTYDKLVPGSFYFLAAKAVNGTDTSDLSNEVSASTLPGVFASPTVNITFDSIQTKMVLKISDKAEIETGYDIFKAIGNDTSFTRVAQIQSANPADTQTILWEDTVVRKNEWYQYFVRTTIADSLWKKAPKTIDYYAKDSMSSSGQSIFTLMYGGLVSPDDSILVLKDKLSEYPIKFNGWSMKVGDSILLGEKGIGDSSFSILIVSNPAMPKFIGVKKEPYFINSGRGYAQDNRLFCGSNDGRYSESRPSILYFEFVNGEFLLERTKLVDTVGRYGSTQQVTTRIFGISDDSILIFIKTFTGTHSISYVSKINVEEDSTQCKFLSVYGADNATGSIPAICQGNMFYYYFTYYSHTRIYCIENFNGLLYNPSTIQYQSIPTQISHYKTLDPLLQNASNIICDSINKIAYIFTDSILYAYNYTVNQAKAPVLFRPITKPKQFIASNKNAQAEYFDVLGRKISLSAIPNARNSRTRRIPSRIVLVKQGTGLSKKAVIH